MMKKKIAITATACFIALGTLTLPVHANANAYGNEPHHAEMLSHHDAIRPYLADTNEFIRECAAITSAKLNRNDWLAARGPRSENAGAWAHRDTIMQEFATCKMHAETDTREQAEARRAEAEALARRQAEETARRRAGDFPLEGAYGREDHHREMQRNHNLIGKHLNDTRFTIYRNCAETASRALNANDGQAARGSRGDNPLAWVERDKIMEDFLRCTGVALDVFFEMQSRMDTTRRDAARHMNSDNPAIRACAMTASEELASENMDTLYHHGRENHPGLWAEYRQIAADYGECVNKAEAAARAAAEAFEKARLADNPTRGTFGDAPHHLEMQRHHNLVRKHINDERDAFRACAATASRALNSNDGKASAGFDANPAAWEARDRIMRNYENCLEQAERAGTR